MKSKPQKTYFHLFEILHIITLFLQITKRKV